MSELTIKDGLGSVSPAKQSENTLRVLQDVVEERARQILGEGFVPTGDDAYKLGQLAGAAACYTMLDLSRTIGNQDLSLSVARMVHELWPWARSWWKPTDRRRDLVKAAALIIAEIERLDRMACARENSPEGGDT